MTITVHDPVCGMDIDPVTAAGTSEYKGQTYYFCSFAARNLLIRTLIRSWPGRSNTLFTEKNNETGLGRDPSLFFCMSQNAYRKIR
jgi:YHS domain-containing protein